MDQNYKFKSTSSQYLRQIMYKQYLREYYKNAVNLSKYGEYITPIQGENDYFCQCIQQRANEIKQGYNDPSQTEYQRVSQILTGTLGGKTTFGNLNRPVTVNYMGGWEGQPGGMPRVPRNYF